MLIEPALSDQIIPLHANYKHLGGVSFKKGCYVGQEIIARLYYKGQCKRQLCVVSSAEALSCGDSVVNEQAQSRGVIVASANNINGDTITLAILELRALDTPLFNTHEQAITIEQDKFSYS